MSYWRTATAFTAIVAGLLYSADGFTRGTTATGQQQDTAPQGAPQGAAPVGAGGGRGGGFSSAAPSDWNDRAGWTQIFDGQSLNGWNCDPNVWSVVDGAITAKSTPEKPTGTTYCSWGGGEPRDFELKVEFRMLVGGNSGIQYRSRRLPPRGGGAGRGAGGPGGAAANPPAAAAGGGRAADPPASSAAAPVAGTPPPVTVSACTLPSPVIFPPQAGRGGGGGRGRGAGGQRGTPGAEAGGGRGQGAGTQTASFNVGGYQYDFDFTGRYPGQLYENGVPADAPQGTNNRGIITYKGQIVHMLPGGRREIIGCVGEDTELKGVMNINNWNYIHIIARGNTLMHLLNGRLMSLSIDDDPQRRKLSGVIAVQIEGMGEVYFRNIWLRNW